MDKIRPVDKITALWALSEAGLGGIFHAFKMPFTGLIIAGVSVLFLTLIGRYSEKNYRQMISAMIIVLIIKMLISPHTPPTAYFAVFFQGITGFLIFRIFGINTLTIYFFAILALVESGFQKILTLSIFYGASIWESINSFYDYLEKTMSFLPALSGTTLTLVIYFGIYLLSALLFAWMTLGVLKGIKGDKSKLFVEYQNFIFETKPEQKKKKQKLIGRRSWLLLILLFIIAILFLFNPDMGWQKAFYVFVRSLLVIVLWYVIAAPLFKYLFERFLRKQKGKFSAELDFVLAFFPTLKSIAFFSLNRNGRINNFSKLRSFFRDVVVLTLMVEDDPVEKKA